MSQQKKTPIISSVSATPTIINVDWNSDNDFELVQVVKKPPHLRSRKPLRRIPIQDVDDLEVGEDAALPWPRPGHNSTLIKCDDLKIVERKLESPKNAKVDEEKPTISMSNEFNMSVPLTTIQFVSDWHQLEKCKELQYEYLKQINPENIPSLFKESLDYDIFSGIIHTLATVFVENNSSVYLYLLKLSEVKRFSMLLMFMENSNKEDLFKLANYMRSNGVEMVDELMFKYGL
ncbi:hypothetical protein RI129_003867 [Pyrocoelia pectoralis]|uniref:RNA-polymerase II-associated protein 3-like C-terminal domain-containing protein n=1 Tax=Pyrocoelia pectoralis TaxID=417401 RepID=A0AAN7VJ60_9COLE